MGHLDRIARIARLADYAVTGSTVWAVTLAGGVRAGLLAFLGLIATWYLSAARVAIAAEKERRGRRVE